MNTLVVLAGFLLVQGRQSKPDSLLHTLTKEGLGFFSLLIREVIATSPAKLPSGGPTFSLDPILRRSPGVPSEPWSGIHLALPSLGALLRDSGLRSFCEPADYSTCRG